MTTTTGESAPANLTIIIGEVEYRITATPVLLSDYWSVEIETLTMDGDRDYEDDPALYETARDAILSAVQIATQRHLVDLP